MREINVVGGGLAGCECAYFLANHGFKVNLYDTKPKKMSPAHSNENFSELVCSNSLKGMKITNACGLLKEEMFRLGSLIVRIGKETKVKAGGALAVDRDIFAEKITETIKRHENISVICDEVEDFLAGDTVIATGPLTQGKLNEEISKHVSALYFYDAAAPIVDGNTIDYEKCFFGDRYGKGDGDYLNLPLTKEEYEIFYKELISAECVELKNFEKKEIFEGCMPIEVMAKRGEDTIRFGPLKPVGLYDPKTNIRGYAVVQLRRESLGNNLYNMVGFQTNLKFQEQKRVFSLIPALRECEFVKYGVMHRNTFINASLNLENGYKLKGRDNVYFAGQITGVEGYVESAMSGLYTALQIYSMDKFGKEIDFTRQTMTGALISYLKTPNEKFQPMNANFGIIDSTEFKLIRNKEERYEKIANKSLQLIEKIKKELEV